MPTYEIGGESFVWFAPPQQLYQDEVEQLTYDGVDDSVFRILAKRGRPFQIESRVDIDTMANGWTKLNTTYSQMVGEAAKQIIHNDIDFDDHNVRFKVMRVQPGSNSGGAGVRAALISGGLTDGNGFWVNATWTLVPVYHATP